MQVVHVISGDLWAGAEVATYHLLLALRRSEVDARCVVLNEGTLAERLRAAGVPVTVFDESRMNPFSILRALRREVATADLVHSHRYKENALAALCGHPRVITQHGRREPFRGRSRMRSGIAEAVGEIALRRADAIIAVSEEVRADLARAGNEQRLFVVWNGLPDPQPALSVREWSKRERCVGVLARLVPVKALGLAIAAVAGCPGLVLEIVGDGPERDALEAAAKASGAAERIRFLGHDPDPLARVAKWRALLVTSLHEGNPLSVIEAMSLGTPVIFAPLSGVRQMVAEGGFEIPSREASVWSEELGQFVDDLERGARLSEGARERFVDAFGDIPCAEAIQAVYRFALGESD